MEPPSRRGAPVFVVITQMPHDVADLTVGDAPVVRDAGDPAQGVSGIGGVGVHLTDDGVLGALHAGQRRHRVADTVVAVQVPLGFQDPRGIGQPQLGGLGEQPHHVLETAVVDGGGVEVHQVGHRKTVGGGQAHEISPNR
ncbi:hypothetical protein MLIT_14090 [Mycolicibacterium litorale]|uniref:Uncharacterized protein n=1 Tax=Mycolicibacterium litorale TaxID=758802 RepID=A0AAD1ILM3_9MYCO|nr:hypothetical protein MLIT_14090 [Mycolicibacterium litorale]